MEQKTTAECENRQQVQMVTALAWDLVVGRTQAQTWQIKGHQPPKNQVVVGSLGMAYNKLPTGDGAPVCGETEASSANTGKALVTFGFG